MVEEPVTRSTANAKPRPRNPRIPAGSRRKIDLGAWHTVLGEAKLRRSVKSLGVLLIARLGAAELKTTRKKLAEDIGVGERTLDRHLPHLEKAGLITQVQHHHPKTGWRTKTTIYATIPDPTVAAVIEPPELPRQPPPRCMSQTAKIGGEAKPPILAEHLADHGLLGGVGTPEERDGVRAAKVPGAPGAPSETPEVTPNWGRDLLAAKARLVVRLPDPDDVDGDAGRVPTFVPPDTGGQQSDSRYAGGAA